MRIKFSRSRVQRLRSQKTVSKQWSKRRKHIHRRFAADYFLVLKLLLFVETFFCTSQLWLPTTAQNFFQRSRSTGYTCLPIFDFSYRYVTYARTLITRVALKVPSKCRKNTWRGCREQWEWRVSTTLETVDSNVVSGSSTARTRHRVLPINTEWPVSYTHLTLPTKRIV